MLEQIKASLAHLRENKPLILCLTNYVTMDFMANSLLALGAAPLMSESIEEIEELVHISNALYINIGTLDKVFLERALLAANIANSLHKPVILDPVGAGASSLRTASALQLLMLANIVRGNPSEIIALSGAQGSTKGVESIHPVEQAINAGNTLARELNKLFIISGPEDYITDGRNMQKIPFGSSLMPLITGMGCTMTAVISAFISNNHDYFQEAVYATAFFGLCGQLAHKQTTVPGNFKQEFINNLYYPDWSFMADELRNS